MVASHCRILTFATAVNYLAAAFTYFGQYSLSRPNPLFGATLRYCSVNSSFGLPRHGLQNFGSESVLLL